MAVRLIIRCSLVPLIYCNGQGAHFNSEGGKLSHPYSWRSSAAGGLVKVMLRNVADGRLIRAGLQLKWGQQAAPPSALRGVTQQRRRRLQPDYRNENKISRQILFGFIWCRRTFLEITVVMMGLSSSLLCLFSAVVLNLCAPRGHINITVPLNWPIAVAWLDKNNHCLTSGRETHVITSSITGETFCAINQDKCHQTQVIVFVFFHASFMTFTTFCTT